MRDGFQNTVEKTGRLIHPHEPSFEKKELLTSSVERMERENFAQNARTLKELIQSSDEQRDNTFEYATREKYGHKTEVNEKTSSPIESCTEAEGLAKLYQFLIDAASSKYLNAEMKGLAKDLLDHLVFIGEHELNKGAETHAARWKAFLDQDPNNQIVVVTEITGQGNYSGIKSDKYVANRILRFFTERELEVYANRLVTDFRKIQVDPQHVRIILVDDWTVTESQLNEELHGMQDRLDKRYQPSIEINLIAASEQLVEEGLQFYADPYANYDPDAENPYGEPDIVIPVKAHYKAPTPETRSIMVTGTHSATDICFETRIEDIVEMLNENDPDVEHYMPPLTNIVRAYRQEKTLRLDSLD